MALFVIHTINKYMHWKQLNADNPPIEEVLAKSAGGDLMIGYVDSTETCYSGFMSLENITHYIPVANLLKLHNELRP